jgi:hypothetical protein
MILQQDEKMTACSLSIEKRSLHGRHLSDASSIGSRSPRRRLPRLSLKVRNDVLAKQPQGVHHLLMPSRVRP